MHYKLVDGESSNMPGVTPVTVGKVVTLDGKQVVLYRVVKEGASSGVTDKHLPDKEDNVAGNEPAKPNNGGKMTLF